MYFNVVLSNESPKKVPINTPIHTMRVNVMAHTFTDNELLPFCYFTHTHTHTHTEFLSVFLLLQKHFFPIDLLTICTYSGNCS